MSQKTAAEALGWSQSKLVRIELGTVPVTPADVRALLSLYGVSDQGVIMSLATLAKEAREGRGFSTYEDVYSPQAIDLFGNEPSARVIYKYEPDFILGLFQPEPYARALLRSLGFSEAIVDRKLEVRIERQRSSTATRGPGSRPTQLPVFPARPRPGPVSCPATGPAPQAPPSYTAP
jgi:transcriptional regulator with XRE-family HTH domain